MKNLSDLLITEKQAQLLDKEKEVKSSLKGFTQGHLPLYKDGSDLSSFEIRRIERANKYLEHMQRKLIEYSRNNDMKKLVLVSDILMRRSTAFHVLTMNKAHKGGMYKETGHRILREINSGIRGIGKKRESMIINRSYILKPNGKGRPIGAPDIKSKFVLTALERILRIIIEPRLGDYQHGFRNHRSAQTAGKEIIKLYRNGNRCIYEFDLKSFFNMINVQLITSKLNSMCPGLGNGIKAITFETNPRFEEYKEEKEIEQIKVGREIAYRKRGFTQGSPIAPLLSIYALEFGEFNKIKNLIMYADDGLVMGTNPNYDMKDDLGVKAKLAGIYIAEDKNHGMVQEEFKFLGLTLNIKTHMISFKDMSCSILEDSLKLRKILEYASYTPEKSIKKHGIGKVMPRSLQGERRITSRLSQSVIEKIYSITMESIQGCNESGLDPTRFKIGGYLQKGGENHISGKPHSASTYASAKMLLYLDESKNKKKKNVRISDYAPSESSSSGTDMKIENNKIFIRYPHNGGVLGHEDERISNLMPSNFYKLTKGDA